MFFSPATDFLADSALVGLAGFAVFQPSTPWARPVGLLAFLLGIQQWVAGLLLALISDHASELVTQALAQIYVLLAGLAWPILIPASLMFIEPHQRRRNLLSVLTVLGAFIGLVAAAAVIRYGFTASIEGSHLAFRCAAGNEARLLWIYALPVCLSFFVSSDVLLRWVGVANAILLAVAYGMYRNDFLPAWTYFATAICFLVYARLWVPKLGLRESAASVTTPR